MGQLFTGENPYAAVLRGQKFAQYRTGALQSTAFAQFDLTPTNGTELVVAYDNTGVTPATLTTRTAAQMWADFPGVTDGTAYLLLIRNSSSGANTMTVGAGSNVTLTGTMTVAQNVTRLFIVTMTSPAAVTIQSMGILAAGA